jgi:hypothetical protein
MSNSKHFSLSYNPLMFRICADEQKHQVCAVLMNDKAVVKVLPHVIRSVNELNIPSGDKQGYEILYFGVNLILMLDYRLSFNVEVKSSDYSDEIEVLIISRKDVSAWKDKDGTDDDNNNNSSSSTERIKMHYSNNGQKINDIYIPSISDAYAFILSNRTSRNNNKESKTKTVKVALTHSWQQEIKESQLKNRL